MTSVDLHPQRRTFRQRGSAVLGAVCIVGCTVMVLGSLSHTNLVFVGAMAVAACWSFVLLVRPSLQLSAAGVHVNNPLRRTTIPWPLVEGCLTRWNLQVCTRERVVTVWAISSSINRSTTSSRFGDEPGAGSGRSVYASARSAQLTPVVEHFIDEGREQWHHDVVAGLLADDRSAQVVRSWDWLDVGLLCAPLVLLVVGVLTG